MKKTILIAGLVILALGVLGVGAVFAQDATPPVPYGHRQMMNGGTEGPMHTFMAIEFSKALDLNVNDVNTRLAAGETMYDIALSAGVTAEEFPAIMTTVRTTALASSPARSRRRRSPRSRPIRCFLTDLAWALVIAPVPARKVA